MARRAKRHRRAVSGQALVEAAILIPILLVFFAGVFDLGRYYVLLSDTRAACDNACRSIEAARDVDAGKLQDDIAALYPSLANSLVLDVGNAEVTTTEHKNGDGYHFYDFEKKDGTFKERTQRLSQEKHKVTVTYTGKWVTPGMMAIASATSGGEFVITCTNTATIDRTLDTW